MVFFLVKIDTATTMFVSQVIQLRYTYEHQLNLTFNMNRICGVHMYTCIWSTQFNNSLNSGCSCYYIV